MKRFYVSMLFVILLLFCVSCYSASAQYIIDDFDRADNNTVGNGWIERENTASPNTIKDNATYQSTDGSSSPMIFRNVGNTDSFNYTVKWRDSVSSVFSNGASAILVNVPEQNTSVFVPVNYSDGLVLMWSRSSQKIFIFQNSVWLANVSMPSPMFDIPSSVFWNINFGLEDSMVYAKVWLENQSEPSDWTLNATAPVNGSGSYLGLMSDWEGDSVIRVYWDGFSTAEYSAPVVSSRTNPSNYACYYGNIEFYCEASSDFMGNVTYNYQVIGTGLGVIDSGSVASTLNTEVLVSNISIVSNPPTNYSFYCTADDGTTNTSASTKTLEGKAPNIVNVSLIPSTNLTTGMNLQAFCGLIYGDCAYNNAINLYYQLITPSGSISDSIVNPNSTTYNVLNYTIDQTGSYELRCYAQDALETFPISFPQYYPNISVFVENHAPVIENVTTTPISYIFNGSDYQVSFDFGDSDTNVDMTLYCYENGTLVNTSFVLNQTSQQGYIADCSMLSLGYGSIVRLKVKVNDSENSTEVYAMAKQVTYSAPSVTFVSLYPATVYDSTNMYGVCSATDLDSDYQIFEYEVLKNDLLFTDGSFSQSATRNYESGNTIALYSENFSDNYKINDFVWTGDYSTIVETSQGAFLYLNYTVPANIIGEQYWQMQAFNLLSDGKVNISVPSECDNSIRQMKVEVTSHSIANGSFYYRNVSVWCYNYSSSQFIALYDALVYGALVGEISLFYNITIFNEAQSIWNLNVSGYLIDTNVTIVNISASSTSVGDIFKMRCRVSDGYSFSSYENSSSIVVLADPAQPPSGGGGGGGVCAINIAPRQVEIADNQLVVEVTLDNACGSDYKPTVTLTDMVNATLDRVRISEIGTVPANKEKTFKVEYKQKFFGGGFTGRALITLEQADFPTVEIPIIVDVGGTGWFSLTGFAVSEPSAPSTENYFTKFIDVILDSITPVVPYVKVWHLALLLGAVFGLVFFSNKMLKSNTMFFLSLMGWIGGTAIASTLIVFLVRFITG